MRHIYLRINKWKVTLRQWNTADKLEDYIGDNKSQILMIWRR